MGEPRNQQGLREDGRACTLMAPVDDGAGGVCTLFGKRSQIQALEQQRKGQVGSSRTQGEPWAECVLSFLLMYAAAWGPCWSVAFPQIERATWKPE